MATPNAKAKMGQRKLRTTSSTGARNKTSASFNASKQARAVKITAARAADQRQKDANFNAQVQANKNAQKSNSQKFVGPSAPKSSGPVNPFQGGILPLNPWNSGITKKQK